jgi:uncharacterized protein YxeA
MKKSIIVILLSLVLTGCGVGTYSLSSGKADEAKLSFIDSKPYNIDVIVDNSSTYKISTVRDKAYKSNRNIKEVTLNAVVLSPGKHFVEVVAGGKKLYSKWIFVSTGEHKIIEL